jgi:hypothetical protein
MQDELFFPEYSDYQCCAMTNEPGNKIISFVKRWSATTASVLFVAGIVWGVFKYTVASEIESALSTMKSDVATMKSQVSSLETASGKTNEKIDRLLEKALDRSFPAADASKQKIVGSLRQIDGILQFAKSQNVNLDQSVIAAYGKRVGALTGDPLLRVSARQTVAALLKYRSSLNSKFVPPVVTDTTPVTKTQDFVVEINEMLLEDVKDGTPLLRQFNYGNIVPPLSPEAAMFLRIGDENRANAATQYFFIDGTHFAFILDGYHIRNAIIKGAKIIYDGGPLILENVYFVDCTFEIKHAPLYQDFANAILAKVPANYKPS